MTKKYSGKKVIKAGEKLIDENLIDNDPVSFSEAADILSYWRSTHEESLEKAFFLIREVALKHDKKAIFAKRLKRLVSIVKKLRRFRKMKLKNMQDIGGCRIILTNEKRLRKVLRDLKKNPEFKLNNGVRVKDYIKKPKEDGYRGYHLIGKFRDSENNIKSIEIQLRTQTQHYWATALEIVDLFTGQALKSNIGERNWKDFFKNTSEQFAVMESIHLFETMPFEKRFVKYTKALEGKKEKIKSCQTTQNISNKLKVVNKFEAFAGSLQVVDNKLSELDKTEYGYVLLEIDVSTSHLSSSFFPHDESGDAEKTYISAEKKAAETDNIIVALVSTTAVGDIKEAYPNYFADSTEFLKLLVLIENVKIDAKKKNIFKWLFGINRLGDLR